MESLSSRRTPTIVLLVLQASRCSSLCRDLGVLVYSVAQRTREIGISIALGGQRGNILALGGAAAFFLVRLIQSLLFGIQPMDPLVLAATALLLGWPRCWPA